LSNRFNGRGRIAPGSEGIVPSETRRRRDACAPFRFTRLGCLQGLPLSNVEFLGEMSDVLHSDALLPLIPPTPFSHKGRRGSLGILMPETEDGTQGSAKNPPL
jgi:hypothetical protein